MNTGPFSATTLVDSSCTKRQVKSNVQPRAVADILPEVLARYGLALDDEQETRPTNDLPVVVSEPRMDYAPASAVITP